MQGPSQSPDVTGATVAPKSSGGIQANEAGQATTSGGTNGSTNGTTAVTPTQAGSALPTTSSEDGVSSTPDSQTDGGTSPSDNTRTGAGNGTGTGTGTGNASSAGGGGDAGGGDSGGGDATVAIVVIVVVVLVACAITSAGVTACKRKSQTDKVLGLPFGG